MRAGRRALRWVAIFVSLGCLSPAQAELRLEAALEWPEGVKADSAFGRELSSRRDAVERSADSTRAWERLAYLYHANEYDDRARHVYDELIASGGGAVDRARWNYLAAKLVMEKGDSSSALAYLERSVEAHDGYPLSLVALGDARFKSGDLEGARSAYEKAVDLEGGATLGRLGLARVWERTDSGDRMAQALEMVLQDDPRNPDALSMLAQWHARRGEERKAYELTEAIIHSSKAPEVDDWFEPIRAAIFDVQRLDFLFLDYFLVGRREAALPYLERLESIDPGNPRWNQYRALLYLGDGYAKKAERACREGMEKEGDVEPLYPLLVKALSLQGRFEEASDFAEAAIKGRGATGDLCLEWSRVLTQSGKWEEALEAIELGLGAAPYEVELHLSRARTAMRLGRAGVARASLASIAQLAPMDAEAQVRAGLVHMEAGHFEEALPFLERARQASPYDDEARELLADAETEVGKAAHGRGDVEAALQRYERALAVEPSHFEAQSMAARALLELGRVGEAERSMRAFLKAAGPHPMFLMMYGDILARAGELSKAREIWERALSTNSGDDGLRRSLQRRLGR